MEGLAAAAVSSYGQAILDLILFVPIELFRSGSCLDPFRLWRIRPSAVVAPIDGLPVFTIFRKYNADFAIFTVLHGYSVSRSAPSCVCVCRVAAVGIISS